MKERGAGDSWLMDRSCNYQVAYALLELLIQRRCFALQHMKFGFVSKLRAKALHCRRQIARSHRCDGAYVDGPGKAVASAVKLGDAPVDGGEPF